MGSIVLSHGSTRLEQMACERLTQESWKGLQQKATTFLLDCDGVLWRGDSALPGATKAIARLKEMGKKVILVTNNSTKSRTSYVKKCKKLGFDNISADDIVTTSAVLADYLKNVIKFPTSKKVFIIGSEGIQSELENVGISGFGVGPDPMAKYGDSIPNVENTPFDIPVDQVGAVVVGHDAHISFPKVLKAATYLHNSDCLYLVTNDDETYPGGNTRIICPGTGSMVAMVSTASRRAPVILGKPHVPMFDYIARKHNVKCDEAVMIGDYLRTDIQFGKRNGMKSILVLTGQSTLHDVEAEKSRADGYVPDFVCDKLGDLAEL